MIVRYASALGLLTILPRALAQTPVYFNFTTIDPSQCVAPAQFQTCNEQAAANLVTCAGLTSNNPTAQQGCACVNGEQKISCFAEACWNRVRRPPRTSPRATLT